MTDTKKLLELCEKATPGPWINLAPYPTVTGPDAAYVAVCDEENEEYRTLNDAAANAAFIADCNPEVVKSLCTELERARELLSWRPIETAKDGDWVLVHYNYHGESGHIAVKQRNNGQWAFPSKFHVPTHWMPLPEPPEGK